MKVNFCSGSVFSNTSTYMKMKCENCFAKTNFCLRIIIYSLSSIRIKSSCFFKPFNVFFKKWCSFINFTNHCWFGPKNWVTLGEMSFCNNVSVAKVFNIWPFWSFNWLKKRFPHISHVFQVKERTKYRSRNGFSQSDGIAQYSANFYRSRKPRKIEDYHRPPSYEPYRPQRPKTIFAGHSDDESYLNNHRTISSSSSTTHFPELKIGNGSSPNPKPPLYHSTSKKSLVPILKAERRNNPTLEKKFPWEVPKYQNPLFNGCESDEELIKPTSAMASAMAAGIDPFYRNGSVSPKFTSHHALCTNQVSFILKKIVEIF